MPVINAEFGKTLQTLAGQWVDKTAEVEQKRLASEDASAALRVARNQESDLIKLIQKKCEQALKSTLRIVVRADSAPSGAILIEQGRVSMIRSDEIVGFEDVRKTPQEIVGIDDEDDEIPNGDIPDGDKIREEVPVVALPRPTAPVTDVAPEGDE